MRIKEQAFLFGKSSSLVGVLTEPPKEGRNSHLPAILLLNSGLIHRVGPYRIYVKIARSLAEMGYVVFRFDFSGFGDSEIRRDNLPFEKSLVSDTQEAMALLGDSRGIERFVLMGICGGADAALDTAQEDPRVAGAILVNPRSHAPFGSLVSNGKVRRPMRKSAAFFLRIWSKALKLRRYYRHALELTEFQLRNLVGAGGKAIFAENQTEADLPALAARGVDLLVVLSEEDFCTDYLQIMLGKDIQELNARSKLRVEFIKGGDHNFILLSMQQDLLRILEQWAQATYLQAPLSVSR